MPGKQKTSDSSAEEQVLDSNSEELENDESQNEGSEETEANSSDADDSNNSEEESRKDLLDVVKDAVKSDEDNDQSEDEDDDDSDKEEDKKGKKSKEDASSASKSGKSEDTEDEGDEGSDEFTEEELKSLNEKTQKRIRNLTSKLENAHAQVEDYKPHAESYRKIDGFMQQYGITPEESAEAFTIMALVKTDPSQALQRMQQHINTISGYVGETLPDDLKQRVEDGTLSEEDAKELSKARATAKLERERREATEKATEKATEERTAQNKQQELATSLDNWQANISKTDPDYQKKHGFLKTQLQALIGELGTPENAEEMVRYANIAYGMVNEQLGQVVSKAPEKKKEKRSLQSRNASGPSPKPKPETTLDVVRLAAGK